MASRTMHLTLRQKVNWRRVWLAVLIGYVLLVIVANLGLGYLAYSHSWLINWQDNPVLGAVYYDK